MPKTIDQIVRGSELPLSIVIVGVGDADFESMETLDADIKPLFSTMFKKYMQRDIVQFVPFLQFNNDSFRLAKEVLQEVPGQLVDFFTRKNIYPNPSKEAERTKILGQLKQNVDTDPLSKQLDSYSREKKEEMIQMAEKAGLDTFAVQDFIEEKGIYENNL